MMTAAEAIDLAFRTWTYEPETARTQPSVTAFSHGTQAVLSSGSFTWRTDLPAVLGGSGDAPSPLQLLLGALASSAVLLVRDTIAPQLGIEVDSVEATASCETDYRALLGMDGMKPRLRNLKMEMQIKAPGGDEAAGRRLTTAWLERCPVYQALLESMTSELVLAA
jgi:uncharacterized OsmC-like protein